MVLRVDRVAPSRGRRASATVSAACPRGQNATAAQGSGSCRAVQCKSTAHTNARLPHSCCGQRPSAPINPHNLAT
jgi:hypothetical protein